MDVDKQLEQIIVSVIESVFHLFKIHRKMIFGNHAVIAEDMLGKRPESLNAVDMIFGSSVHQVFGVIGVIDGQVFAQSLERVVAPKSVGAVDRALSDLLPDNSHRALPC